MSELMRYVTDEAFVRTDLDLDQVLDVGITGESGAGLIEALKADPGRKIGIAKDGQVVAVLIDGQDMAIFEDLEIAAEEERLEEFHRDNPDDGVRYTLDGEPVQDVD